MDYNALCLVTYTREYLRKIGVINRVILVHITLHKLFGSHKLN
jgi:hypothetical protein